MTKTKTIPALPDGIQALPPRARSAEVAARAGVSRATVSYVLNNRSDVTIPEPTRQRVLTAANDLGYRVNRTARALKTQQTGIIAYISAKLHHPLRTKMLFQMQQETERDGYELMIHTDPNRLDLDSADGIMVHGAFSIPQNVLSEAKARRKPVVLFGHHSGDGSVDTVHVDLGVGVRESAQHLLGQNCRRIAYLYVASSHGLPDDRAEIYKETMRVAGGQPEILWAEDETRHSARQAVLDYARTHPQGCPDGLLARTDDFAIAACRAVWDMGLTVGEDVKIVGCDGIEGTEYHYVPISTLVIPTDEVTHTAWQMIRQRLATPNLPIQRVTIVPPLVMRQSSLGKEELLP